LGISFNIEDSLEGYFAEEHRQFVAMLGVIEEAQPDLAMNG